MNCRSLPPQERAVLWCARTWHLSHCDEFVAPLMHESREDLHERGETHTHTPPKLDQAVRKPPNFHWAGPVAQQPPIWTDVLAEMSRHIYIRNKIGEGIQAPIFQVTMLRFEIRHHFYFINFVG